MTEDDAARLFEEFHGREPEDGELANLEMSQPIPALVIGKAVGIRYKKSGGDEVFEHLFDDENAGILLVPADGEGAFYVLQGNFKFTPVGFVG